MESCSIIETKLPKVCVHSYSGWNFDSIILTIHWLHRQLDSMLLPAHGLFGGLGQRHNFLKNWLTAVVRTHKDNGNVGNPLAWTCVWAQLQHGDAGQLLQRRDMEEGLNCKMVMLASIHAHGVSADRGWFRNFEPGEWVGFWSQLNWGVWAKVLPCDTHRRAPKILEGGVKISFSCQRRIYVFLLEKM